MILERLSLPESIHVSKRFRLTLEATILELEADAAQDERVVPLLESPDHRRRQRLLVDAQLERAWQLRELLARTVVRSERVA